MLPLLLLQPAPCLFCLFFPRWSPLLGLCPGRPASLTWYLGVYATALVCLAASLLREAFHGFLARVESPCTPKALSPAAAWSCQSAGGIADEHVTLVHSAGSRVLVEFAQHCGPQLL